MPRRRTDKQLMELLLHYLEKAQYNEATRSWTVQLESEKDPIYISGLCELAFCLEIFKIFTDSEESRARTILYKNEPTTSNQYFPYFFSSLENVWKVDRLAFVNNIIKSM